MHVEFTPGDLSPQEAKGLIALISAMYPTAVAAPGAVHAPPPATTINVVPLAISLPEAEEPLHAVDPAVAFGAAPAPQPAMPAVAPPPTEAVGSAPPAGVDVDADGFPHDARIHASTKGKNADGRWKQRRNTPADTVAAVQAELRQLMAIPGPQPVAPAASSAAPIPTPPPPPPAASAPTTVTPPPPSPVTAASPIPAPPPTDPAPLPGGATTLITGPVSDFAGIMRKVTQAQSAGKLTSIHVNNILAGMQLNALRDLVARPDLIPSFSDQVDSYIATA